MSLRLCQIVELRQFYCLSPILFNLSSEPIIRKAKEENHYKIYENTVQMNSYYDALIVSLLLIVGDEYHSRKYKES